MNKSQVRLLSIFTIWTQFGGMEEFKVLHRENNGPCFALKEQQEER